MSIKTIDKQIQGSEGIAKKINKGAEKMVFDILQSTQYSTPIPSSVRELVTNACESQREKEIGVEILKGEKKIEDYYNLVPQQVDKIPIIPNPDYTNIFINYEEILEWFR